MRIRGTMLSLGLSGWIIACGDDSGFKSGVNQNDPTKIPPVSANDTGGAGAKPKNDLDAGGFGKLGAVSDTQSVSLKVDLVFAIDTSGSMNEELAATQAKILIIAERLHKTNARCQAIGEQRDRITKIGIYFLR